MYWGPGNVVCLFVCFLFLFYMIKKTVVKSALKGSELF